MMLVLMGIVCIFHLSTGSDKFRAFVADIEDTSKQWKECTEQLAVATILNEVINRTNAEQEVEIKQLKEQLNQTNVQLATEMQKQKGMKIVHFSNLEFILFSAHVL